MQGSILEPEDKQALVPHGTDLGIYLNSVGIPSLAQATMLFALPSLL